MQQELLGPHLLLLDFVHSKWDDCPHFEVVPLEQSVVGEVALH
jgi:hypothetical protein